MRGFLHRIARLERLAATLDECVVHVRYFDATSGELLLDRTITLPSALAPAVTRPPLPTEARAPLEGKRK